MTERAEQIIAALRVAGPAAVIGFLLGLFLWYRGSLTGRGQLALVMLAATAVGFAVGFLVARGTFRTSQGLVNLASAAGNLPPTASYSLQEALVARGELAAARRSYEEHLEAHPGDLSAHLALARLCAHRLGDPRSAERLFLVARRLARSAEAQRAIGNALIDLYRAGGETGKEMAELARFADRFAGTPEGEGARGALRRLKEPPARSSG
jgi:hypothetical protein